jgi:hypothetical protein
MLKFLLYMICISLMGRGLGSYSVMYFKMFPENKLWIVFLLIVILIMLLFIVNFGFVIFGYIPFPA